MFNEGDLLPDTIKIKLEALSSSAEPSGFKIIKVPVHLRNANDQAYEPQTVAIGPLNYHLRGENHLVEMEENKMRYLKVLLQRNGVENLTIYLDAMKELEDIARSCYAETKRLNSDEFVEMMLLDACFIVELFRKCLLSSHFEARYNDPLISMLWIPKKVGRDLLLVENQLPFSVLQKFYDMTKTPEEEKELNFYQLILRFFERLLPHPLLEGPKIGNMGGEIHLLGFIHDSYWVWNWKPRPLTVGRQRDRKFIRCATELEEAGIKFENIIIERAQQSMFDIVFDEYKGIMKIPSLVIDDDTESLIRNLIALEHFSSFVSEYSPFVNYFKFMDCLINTTKDVKILCDSRIFVNLLGDEAVVAKMFNRVADSVSLPFFNCYEDVFDRANNYCERPWNKWMANLRGEYFNTPWAIISFFAALILLILTAAQTVFSVL